MEILSRKLPSEDHSNGSLRSLVMAKALDLIRNIHTAFVAPVDEHDGNDEPTGSKEDPALEDAKRRRVLHALLDLISLEGIYPSLSRDVGIPLEKRLISVLPTGVIAKQSQVPTGNKSENEALLHQILTALSENLLDDRLSIQPIIRDRILTDILAGIAELAFNSQSLHQDVKGNYKNLLQRAINEYDSHSFVNHFRHFFAELIPVLQHLCFYQCFPPSLYHPLRHGLKRKLLANYHTFLCVKMVSSKRSCSLLLSLRHHSATILRIPLRIELPSRYRPSCKYQDYYLPFPAE